MREKEMFRERVGVLSACFECRKRDLGVDSRIVERL